MKPKVVYTVAALLIAFNVYAGVKDIQHDRYIQQTQRRDSDQERCITEQAVWLQDWLQWRWVKNPERTSVEIIRYHEDHPQPQCVIVPPQ